MDTIIKIIIFSLSFVQVTGKHVGIVSPMGLPERGNVYFDKQATMHRDEIHKLYYMLVEKLEQSGYRVSIVNSAHECANSHYIISFSADCSFIEQFADLRAKKIFFNFEPPLIKSIEHIRKYQRYFDKIFVLYDEIVDNFKIFKFFFPQPNLKLIEKQIDFNKKKLCTMIFGNHESGAANQLYSERLKVIKQFEKSNTKDFEFYGFGWSADYKTYRGSIEHKAPILKNYKFCFCYENSRYAGYITEKIFDSMVAGCVPVYLGAPNIEKFVPANCFINRENFKTDNELYNFLKTMKEEEYNLYLENSKLFLASAEAQLFSIDYFITIVLDALAK